MTDQKHFECLTAKSAFAPAILIELIGWCLDGSISESEIKTRKRTYFYDLTDEGVTVKIKDDEPDIEDDVDLLFLVKAFLGLNLIGADVRVDGLWRGRFPDGEFLQKNLKPDMLIKDLDQSLVYDVFLSLNNLLEVRQILTIQSKPITDLLKDKAFCSAFPSVQSKWGDYGFMRHRSGTEIKTTWNDKVYIKSHGYEAPCPVEELLEAWIKLKKIDVDVDPGFQSYRVNKWKLAKMLGRVPQEHKQKVYEWVNDTQFAIEEFHDSHGRTYTPETFECYFGNSVITADRNYVFELIEC
ncbi:MAG: hypothetical protein IPG59_23200 [Candidatus Melainabacteria bacterium]|nr:MAG: hypothetical protein IPG59_23200 [Candidatus Melainabacteria bacterium]